MVLSKAFFFFVCQISRFLKASSQSFVNARHFFEQSWIVLYIQDNQPNIQPAIRRSRRLPNHQPSPSGKSALGTRLALYPSGVALVSISLALGVIFTRVRVSLALLSQRNNRVLKCDVIKMKFLKLWDLSGYSERTMSKRPTCQK